MNKIELLCAFPPGHKHAYNFKDLTGTETDTYKVIGLAGFILNKNRKRRTVYNVLCFCGKEFQARGNDLVTKQIKSCGCKKKEATTLFNKTTKTKVMYNTFSAVWQSYKRGAIDRGLVFEIDKKQFYELTQRNCYYCGTQPAQIRKPRYEGKFSSYIYNGMDRLDNSAGYTPENCVPACCMCNRMKRDHSLPEFINKIKEILKIHG